MSNDSVKNRYLAQLTHFYRSKKKGLIFVIGSLAGIIIVILLLVLTKPVQLTPFLSQQPIELSPISWGGRIKFIIMGVICLGGLWYGSSILWNRRHPLHIQENGIEDTGSFKELISWGNILDVAISQTENGSILKILVDKPIPPFPNGKVTIDLDAFECDPNEIYESVLYHWSKNRRV